eukprot:XP_028343242.1 uncharacterized protein LOC114485646 [Physeter catodon]
MENSSFPVRLIVNRPGEPPRALDVQIDSTWTVNQVIEAHVTPAAGERTRLIFLGRILDGRCRLSLYLEDAIQRPTSRVERNRRLPASPSCREPAESAARRAPCTIHVHVSREPVHATEGTGNTPPQTDPDYGESNDWSFTVLRITSCIILCACWYHRSVCASEYNAVSTGILCAFTAMYLFLIRHILLYPLAESRLIWSRQDTGWRGV